MSAAVADATPDGSVESAQQQILGLLSDPEDKETKDDAAGAAPDHADEGQAGAAEDEPDKGDDPEQAKSDEKNEEPSDKVEKPQTYKTRVAGQEVEVTLEEALKGYSRTEDYTRKTQELAEARKKWESDEVAAVRAERAQYGALLGQIQTALEDLTPKEPDFAKLQKELTPEQYAAEVTGWHDRNKKIEQIRAERKRIADAEQAEASKGYAEYVKAERDALVKKLPEMADAAKGKALMGEMRELARSIGFEDKDVDAVTDHRLVLLLNMALQHDRASKKAVAVKEKIEKAKDPTPPGAKKDPQKPDELRAAKAKARETGSVDDAAAAIARLELG